MSMLISLLLEEQTIWIRIDWMSNEVLDEPAQTQSLTIAWATRIET